MYKLWKSCSTRKLKPISGEKITLGYVKQYTYYKKAYMHHFCTPIGLIFTRATLASVGRPIAVVVCLSVRPSVAGFYWSG